MSKLLERGKPFLFIIVLIGALVSMYFLYSRMNMLQGHSIIIEKCSSDNVGLIHIDVSGAVENPGVKELPFDGIVFDAIEAAGGFSEEANGEFVAANINLAARIQDGQKIYVPKLNEQMSQSTVPHTQPPATSLINLNTASLEELGTLPGVGDSYAQRIIDARPFQSIDQLKNVKGIGEKKFESIKDLVTI